MSTDNIAEANTNETEKKGFGIIHQYTKDLSFENCLSHEDLLSGEITPTGEISVSVNAEAINDTISEVTIKVTIEAKDTEKNKTVYITDVEYCGLVAIEGLEDQERNAVLMVETPRLLFPFVRHLVAYTTREGGFVALNLEPIDFLGLWLSNMQDNATGQA